LACYFKGRSQANNIRESSAEEEFWVQRRGSKSRRVSSWLVFMTKYSGDQSKEDKIGGACSTYGNKRDMDSLGVEERLILKRILIK
jgi:hypothetical protein